MAISINKLDLNLLRVFHAVMEERSVLRAGHRICISQSAVSHALARLREMLDDELFIRTSTGMQPTARAVIMAPLIHDAWKSLEAAMRTPRFDPASSTKQFTIAVSDFIGLIMVPDLLCLLRREAPFVDLVIRPDSWIDLAEQINLGQIDAVIGTFKNVPPRFRSNLLFAYDDVLIAHSSRKLGKLSVDSLSGLSIAAVSLQSGQAEAVDGFVSVSGLARRVEIYDRAALERTFSGLGRSPRIAVSLSHSLSIPALLEDTDLTAIVPRPLARSLTRLHQTLSLHELPYETTLVDVSVLWHERSADNAPQLWLLEMLRRATEPLRGRLLKFGGLNQPTSPASSRISVP
jgi:DNA-binding transcriptional LysR family regulator